jgi:hypothetical protein
VASNGKIKINKAVKILMLEMVDLTADAAEGRHFTSAAQGSRLCLAL